MPTLNFKKQFADAVERHQKNQSIRAHRARPFKAGDRLYLYTGLRTKACRKLGEATVHAVREINITDTDVTLDGRTLNRDDAAGLARLDGFECIDDFREFFRSHYGLPFRGQLILW